jgi:hypothetical protein
LCAAAPTLFRRWLILPGLSVVPTRERAVGQAGDRERDRSPTERWSISGMFSGGVSGLVLGAQVAVMQLYNGRSQEYCPYAFIGGGISGGMKGGASIAGESTWTDFRVPEPHTFLDFDAFGAIYGAELTVGVGGANNWLNIYTVDHAPNPLDLGGISVGVNGGIGWTPGILLALVSLRGTYQKMSEIKPSQIGAAIKARMRNSASVRRWISVAARM